MSDERAAIDSEPDDLSEYGLFRQLGAEQRDRQTLALLKRLFELEQQTSPAGGEKTAIGKDAHASEALAIAGVLVQLVAGWALDHYQGLFLKKFNPSANAHEHERAGAALREPISDPIAARRLLTSLLMMNPGGFSPALKEAAVEALKALDYGELLPLFRPGKHRKVKYREYRLRLRALAFVAYRKACGQQERISQRQVAAAFGFVQSQDENDMSNVPLPEWKKQVRREFGEAELQLAFLDAENAAKLKSQLGQLSATGGSLSDLGAFLAYNDDALQIVGQEYQRAVKSKKKAPPVSKERGR